MIILHNNSRKKETGNINLQNQKETHQLKRAGLWSVIWGIRYRQRKNMSCKYYVRIMRKISSIAPSSLYNFSRLALEITMFETDSVNLSSLVRLLLNAFMFPLLVAVKMSLDPVIGNCETTTSTKGKQLKLSSWSLYHEKELYQMSY